MYNKKPLREAINNLDRTKAPAKKKDIIVDPMGQWKYPGQNTRIPGNDITMQGVPYPVWAVPNVGTPQMMYPEQDYYFPGADHVDEYPQIAQRGGDISIPDLNQYEDGGEYDLTQEEIDDLIAQGYEVEDVDTDEYKKGGTPRSLPKKKSSKAYSRSLTATNKLFAQSPLTKKSKSRKNKIFDPNAKYYQDGGEAILPEMQKVSDKTVSDNNGGVRVQQFVGNPNTQLRPELQAIIDNIGTTTEIKEPSIKQCPEGYIWNWEKRDCVKVPKNSIIVKTQEEYDRLNKIYEEARKRNAYAQKYIDLENKYFLQRGFEPINSLSTIGDKDLKYVQIPGDLSNVRLIKDKNGRLQLTGIPDWDPNQELLSSYIAKAKKEGLQHTGKAYRISEGESLPQFKEIKPVLAEEQISLAPRPVLPIEHNLPEQQLILPKENKNTLNILEQVDVPRTMKVPVESTETYYVQTYPGGPKVPRQRPVTTYQEVPYTDERARKISGYNMNTGTYTEPSLNVAYPPAYIEAIQNMFKYQEGGVPYNYNPFVSNEPEGQEISMPFTPQRTANDPEDYNQFLSYSETAPENRRPDENYFYGDPNNYDHYGMWDALGKPKDFQQALQMNPDWQPDPYDKMYHGFSVNPYTGVFLKSGKPGENKPGDTTWMEIAGHYLSPRAQMDTPVFDPELQRFKYIPNKEKGGFQDDITRRRKLLRDWTYGASIGTLHKAQLGFDNQSALDRFMPNEAKEETPIFYTPQEPTNLKEVKVTAEAPEWTRYQKEYQKTKPWEDYLYDEQKKYLKRTKGLNKAAGVSMDNFPQAERIRIKQKYDQKMNNYITKRLGQKFGFNPSRRGDWLDLLTPKEREIVSGSKYGSKLQPSAWSNFLSGLRSTYNAIPDYYKPTKDITAPIPGLTAAENKERLKDIFEGLNIFAPLDVPGMVVANKMKNMNVENPSWYSGETMGNVNPWEVMALNPLTYTLDAPFLAEGLVNLGRGVAEGVKVTGRAVSKAKSAVPQATKNVSLNAPLKSGLGDMDMGMYTIKNPDYYTQLLKTYDNRALPAANRKFYKDLIATVKKQNGLVTERQLNELKRLGTGNFDFGSKGYNKGYQEGGFTDELDYEDVDLTPEEIDWYLANGYDLEDLGDSESFDDYLPEAQEGLVFKGKTNVIPQKEPVPVKKVEPVKKPVAPVQRELSPYEKIMIENLNRQPAFPKKKQIVVQQQDETKPLKKLPNKVVPQYTVSDEAFLRPTSKIQMSQTVQPLKKKSNIQKTEEYVFPAMNLGAGAPPPSLTRIPSNQPIAGGMGSYFDATKNNIVVKRSQKLKEEDKVVKDNKPLKKLPNKITPQYTLSDERISGQTSSVKGSELDIKPLNPKIKQYQTVVSNLDKNLQKVYYDMTNPSLDTAKKSSARKRYNELVSKRNNYITAINDVKEDEAGWFDASINEMPTIGKPFQKWGLADNPSYINYDLPKFESYEDKQKKEQENFKQSKRFEELNPGKSEFTRWKFRAAASNDDPLKVAIYGTRGERANETVDIDSPGAIMHFLDQSPKSGFVSKETKNFYKSLKDTDYVGYLKPNGDGTHSVQYKPRKEFNQDNLYKNTFLVRQVKFDNIDFNNKVEDDNFSGHTYPTLKGTGQVALPISSDPDENVYDYSSGQSVVFIFKYNGKIRYQHFAGSRNEIKKEGQELKKMYNLKDGALTIGLADAGSYSSAVSGKINNDKLNSKDYGYYNPNQSTGAGMAIIP